MSLNQNKPLTRSSSTSTVNAQSNSARKDDTDSVMTVNDLWIKMQSLVTTITQSNERLEAKLDSCMDQMNNRMDALEEKFAASKSECDGHLATVSAQVDNIRSDVMQANRRLDSSGRAHELVISGVPYLQTEDLRQVFRNIASSLGYQDDDVPTAILKRLARYPIAQGATPPILCEFAMRTARDDFYRTYLQRRSLSLRHIGFDSNNRVFINENLSPAMREVRIEAIKLKKQGRISKVFTRDGAVYVKRSEADDAVAIHSITELH